MSTPIAGTEVRPPRPLLLVVEEEPLAGVLPWPELESAYEIAFARDEAGAIAFLRSRQAALVLVDLGDAERAFRLREQLLAADLSAPMLLMTARGDEAAAVEALRRGFVDYMSKREENLRSDLLRRRIDGNLDLARLKRENESLQNAIEESQARLFNVYDSLDDVIMQVDEDCRVVSLNRSAAAIASIEPKDGVGKLCWELFDFYPCEQRRRKESCHIYRTFIEDETIRGERTDARTGEIHQYMTFITTLKDKDYTVYRETDITEKRRLEARIAAALRTLGAPGEDG